MTTPQEAITAEKIKTFGECCHAVAVKYKLGLTLVTGHKASYWTEAAEMYAQQYSLQQNKSEVRGREIEFAEFVGKRCPLFKKPNMWFMSKDSVGETTSELYQLFLSSNPIAVEGEEPFKMPTDKQLVDIAILFSQQKGMVKKMELANMLAMSQFILNRLHENKDVMIPSKTETK